MTDSPSRSSSLALSGVRVLLHIRNGTATTTPPPRQSTRRIAGQRCGKPVDAKEVLRVARAQVAQLGGTLALSEAAADLIVFHGGSPAFLDAMHARFKAVVCPDYLAACLAADQRVSIAPYVVSPVAVKSGPDAALVPSARNTAGGGEKVKSSPRRRSTGTAASASAAASTRTSGLVSPREAAVTEVRHTASTPSAPALTDKRCGNSPCGSAPRAHLLTRQSPRASVAGPSRRLVLLDDDEDEDAKGAAQQCKRPEALVHPSRKPYLLLDEDDDRVDGKEGEECAILAPTAPPTKTAAAAALRAVVTINGSEEAEGCSAPTQLQHAEHTRNDVQRAVDTAAQEAAEEEDRIRHAVLRSTAGAAVTRRRGRPPTAAHTVSSHKSTAVGGGHPPVEPAKRGGLPSEGGALREQDPFLSSTAADTQPSASTPPPPLSRTASTVSLGEAASSDLIGDGGCGGGCVTQPLECGELHSPPPNNASCCGETGESSACRTPPSTGRKRPRSRSSSSSAHGCTSAPVKASVPHSPRHGKEEQPTGCTTTTIAACSDMAAVPQVRRKKAAPPAAAARRRPSSAPSTRPLHTVSRRKRATAAVAAAPYDAVAVDEPPLDMAFTDPALLRPLTPDSAEATALCVHIFLDVQHSAPAPSSSAFLSSFLRDVVEQLGAACVVLGNADEDDDDDDDDARGSCWFKSQRQSRRGRHGSAAAQPPTHLVVSEHAVLTPDLLYYKALGIPMVTPQWLYDAVALGSLPQVVPDVHAHPSYGDGHRREKVDGDDDLGVPSDVRPQPRRETLLGVEEGEDDGDVVDGAALHGTHPPVAPTQASTRVAVPSSQPLPGRTATLRRLHKEVADAFVPAGQQARRPFYRPIFADRMFYLHVPPVDLAKAHAAPSTQRGSSRNGCGTYLGDVTAALAQVAALVRILGGTVTRNLESTYLDVVLDLTGFYDNLAEAGPTSTVATEDVTASLIRTLRESLSCAYHDALQRVSQLLGPDAIETRGAPWSPSGGAAVGPPPPVPIVGIPWLVHSVLAREWTATDPFLLRSHVLAAQVAATHGGEPPRAENPSPPPPPPPREEAPADAASQGAVWSALMAAAAAPHRKQSCGPHAAMKAPGLQASTQEAAAMLLNEAPLLSSREAALRNAGEVFSLAHICYSEEDDDDDDDEETGAVADARALHW